MSGLTGSRIVAGALALAGILVAALYIWSFGRDEAIRSLQVPVAPAPLFACATADMPPAARWAHHALKNTTLNIVAVSDGVNWIRQDTGAEI